MEQFKEEIESLKDLGFEYPLRANLDFNRFQIYDKVNRLVYPPKQSGSLAWKEKERKFIQYVVKLFNEDCTENASIVEEKPIPVAPVAPVVKRGRTPKAK